MKFCQNLTFAWEKKKLKFGFDKWNTKKFEKFRCDLGLDEKKTLIRREFEIYYFNLSLCEIFNSY